MVPWYLNPKNILLMVLGVIIVVVGVLYLFQRTTVAKQKTTIETQAKDILALQKDKADLQGQVNDGKAQIDRIKRANQAQQVISNTTSTLMSEVEKIKSKCVLEKEDEIKINNVVRYFNSFGVLFVVPKGNSNSKTNSKVLP